MSGKAGDDGDDRKDAVKPFGRLPTEAAARAAVLLERSRPAPRRPRLSDPELEARMIAAESQNAISYARKEDACDQARRAVEAIEASSQSGDGIVIDIGDEDSVVHHVDELRACAHRR